MSVYSSHSAKRLYVEVESRNRNFRQYASPPVDDIQQAFVQYGDDDRPPCFFLNFPQSLVFLSFYIYRLYFIHRYAGIVREALAAIAADKKDVPYFHEQRVAAYIEEGQTGDFIPREIYLLYIELLR